MKIFTTTKKFKVEGKETVTETFTLSPMTKITTFSIFDVI